MPDYRRNRVPGGAYFFTVNLRDRQSDLLTTEIQSLRAAVRETKHEHSFHIDAWVVLPEHLHCLWTLPPGDSDFSLRWKLIKARFSKSLPNEGVRLRQGERGIWQRRFWEHTIRDDRDYAAHMDYIHFNPVKHGLIAEAANWPFSTFKRCVALGLYPPSWSGCANLIDAGERA